MIRILYIFCKKYLPAAAVEWLRSAYLYFRRPLLKKIIMDSPWLSSVGLLKKYTYPDELFIFMTTRCNIRCVICRREEHKPKDLTFENINKLKSVVERAKIIDLTGWGEPFLYKELSGVVEYISGINKKQNLIRITTNGTRLEKKHAVLFNGRLYSFIISLNAATRDTYNRDMQYSDFDDVVARVKDFMSGLDKESANKVVLHFVAHANNYHEFSEFVMLAERLGIGNVSIGHYMIHTVEHLNLSLLNVKKEYNESLLKAEELALTKGIAFYSRKFFSEEKEGKYTERCFYPYTQFFVQPDGEVAGPCCYAGYYHMGNVFNDGFEAVWYGEKYKKLRKSRHLAACKKCILYSSFDSITSHFYEDLISGKEKEIKKFFRTGA